MFVSLYFVCKLLPKESICLTLTVPTQPRLEAELDGVHLLFKSDRVRICGDIWNEWMITTFYR